MRFVIQTSLHHPIGCLLSASSLRQPIQLVPACRQAGASASICRSVASSVRQAHARFDAGRGEPPVRPCRGEQRRQAHSAISTNVIGACKVCRAVSIRFNLTRLQPSLPFQFSSQTKRQIWPSGASPVLGDVASRRAEVALASQLFGQDVPVDTQGLAPRTINEFLRVSFEFDHPKTVQ